MITLRTFRTVSVVVSLGLLAGCKLAVMVVEGGEVQVDPLLFPASTCSEGMICMHEISDTNYNHSFFAVPKPGWRFVKWSTGDNFLCSNNTSSSCEVNNAFLAGNEVAEAIVASPKTYYLMPLFEPLTEIGATVTMNGKAWAPMSGFGDLSWDDINAARAPESSQAYLAEVFFSVAITNFGGHATTLLTDDSSAGHSAWFYRTP
ncbi:MAG: hypothetical protein IPG06_03495 [Haliea sp.]|nr:hypothetical protein [Haliea sp.]